MISFPAHITDLYAPPICNSKSQAMPLIDKNKRVYDLNQAAPNYPPPPVITAKLHDYLNNEPFYTYTADDGLPELRQAIATELNDLYGCDTKAKNICMVAGANNGFFSTINTIAKPGDEIILLEPYYFNHFMALKLQNLVPVIVTQVPETGFALPLAAIAQAITAKTRAIVLVNPSNPTGKSYSQSEINSLGEICKRHSIVLIADEVYNYFHTEFPTSMLQSPVEFDFVAIHSYSKTFSLTGLRIGLVCSSPTFIEHFLKVQDSNLICAPRLGQFAALTGLRYAQPWLTEKRQLLADRITKFTKLFATKQSIFSIVAGGGI